MKLSVRDTKKFQKTVWGYYRKEGRKLAWRETQDPYRIFVSEVMLQQTQVARVVKKYPEFIKRFPNFRALAKATTAEVLKVWQGMGYNRRALYLCRAARIVCEEYGGKLPEDIEKLDALPGIGKATAASVFVFAWDEPAVFLETNIRTVFIHFFFPRRKKVRDEELLPFVEQTLPSKVQPFCRSKVEPFSVREWYYALMDYGAMLKKTRENFSRKSAAYARQSKFVGSHRELRGEIVRRATSGGAVQEKDLISFRAAGLPVKKILSDLVAEGFLKKRADGFIIC